MDKYDEHSSMMESFEILIDNFQKHLDKCIENYNAYMVKESMIKINNDVRNTSNMNLGLEIKNEENILVLENRIEIADRKLETIKESQKRYLKTLV